VGIALALKHDWHRGLYYGVSVELSLWFCILIASGFGGVVALSGALNTRNIPTLSGLAENISISQNLSPLMVFSVG